ncbi:PREDICTED: immunoglobulin superfamily member 2 isoform X2 [Chinchilla lanigera]|uniref:immunoglobulin superfamily member 2 isoform X2 n=1 Tax=Chinchilla lanigera TaxID=34839 RepID=UPI000696957C|nr:PREDICTED: immunoglobulin superfamily member 2 isoform X2 [Chinchilla lanigera]
MAHVLYVASFSLLLAKLSTGQREVTVQKGPLYRAEGYAVSIGCNVTGHQGPSEQHFQWSVYLPTAPSREIQIISTKDAAFSYAVYAPRVKSRDIYIERVQGNSVFLHISKLQMKDAGEYECHTLNTDGKYYGSYSAKTKLTVRDFQVSITAESTFAEGKPLQLVCLVVGSSQDPQLQVVWLLNGIEIAHIDAGGVLDLKKDYKDRASQGQLQVSRLSPKAFSLKTFSAGPEDEGTYSCTVTEVVRTPMGSWQVLQRKQSPVRQVHLKKPAARGVVVSAKQQAVWEGEPLTLLCKTDGTESPLSVSWWHIPQDHTAPMFIAGMEQDGTLQLGASTEGPRSHGSTRLDKVDRGTFRLEITFTTVTESGVYECRVSERTQNRVGDLYWAHNISVTVKSLKSSLQVNLMSRQPKVKLMDTFDLSCIAKAAYSGLALPITVTWYFQPVRSQIFHQIIRITHNGTVEWGDFLSQFHKKVKVSQTSYCSQLLIYDSTVEETGMYQCKVEVYDRNSLHTNNPAKASATSYPLKISVTLPESTLRVNASHQYQEISINSNTVIECNVSSQHARNLQLAITWYFSPISSSTSWLKILEMDQTNVVKYGDEFHTPRRKQKFHSAKISQNLFQLHILSVEDSDQGTYYCAVEEWLLFTNGTWQRLGAEKSGLTELKLKPTGSKVNISKIYLTENATEHGNVDIHCSLEGSGDSTSLYSVTWFWSRGDTRRHMLVHLQHDGLLEYGDEGRRRHLHCYRSSPTDFVLKLHEVKEEEAGMYWCSVAEWQLHGHPSKWVNQASDESQSMVLRVLSSEPTFPARICSSAPLLYFLVVCPIVMFGLLLISLLCLYQKARKLSRESLSAQKEKALWVGMKGAGGWTADRREEEEEDEHN